MALRFVRTDIPGKDAVIYADAGLVLRHPNPVMSDMLGHFPAIYLDASRPVQVQLLSAARSVVASHRMAPGMAGIATTPDDGGLFADLVHMAPPAHLRALRTEGWDSHGSGAADYVSDALATPDLARDHPRFCVTTANGRCFRLNPTGGMITVEQGGARGDPSGSGRIDDRAAIQATVDYAATVGVTKIGLSAPLYTVWFPKRTSPPFTEAVDGHGIVIAPDQQIHMIGLGSARSTLRFLSPGGVSPDGTTPGQAFQVVDGKVWRGSGFYLYATRPIERRVLDRTSPRQSLTLEHLVIDGATRKSGYYGWPARLADGAGWDITHKGIRSRADLRGADITILDCVMTGWRGETVYATDDPAAKLTVRNSTFLHSNGQGLNPNGCMVDVQGCKIQDCYVGIEGWTGLGRGRIIDVEITDCYGIPGKSGGAFALDGEFAENRRIQMHAPGPDIADNPAPPGNLGRFRTQQGQISLVVRNCGPGLIGSWLTGKIVATDTRLVLGDGTAFAGGARHLDLDITLITDTNEQAHVVIANRYTGVTTDHIHLRIDNQATPAAIAANRRPDTVMTWHGALGSDVTVQISGRDGVQAPKPDAPTSGPSPRITHK
ncbi:hypothetical protein ASE49_02995 [Novosphingobium sp. Leaf2]|nr:hypothetical protein ASE49_02995 [Novosphingobium sp. Leaf2]